MHVYRGQKMAEVFQDRNAKTLRDDEDGSFHSSKCKLRANACCSPGLNSVKSSSSPGPRLELPTSAKSNLFDTSGSQFLAWSGMPREGTVQTDPVRKHRSPKETRQGAGAVRSPPAPASARSSKRQKLAKPTRRARPSRPKQVARHRKSRQVVDSCGEPQRVRPRIWCGCARHGSLHSRARVARPILDFQ